VTRAGDEARISVLVTVDQAQAFRVFTEEIDQWWRRGPAYRASGQSRGVLCLEAGVGGRLYESVDTPGGLRVFETGRVIAWEPPHRVVIEWRGVTFGPGEKTEVEVCFLASPGGTQVTVVHRGWADLPGDHPVRHGQDVPTFIGRMAMWWAALLTSLREHSRPGREPADV
jgi:uncharacterized protein YndB with AHSA1/START domain